MPELNEFEILGNIIISMTIKNGGKLEVSRKDWEGISNYMCLREYDEEKDVDVFTIVRHPRTRVN